MDCICNEGYVTSSSDGVQTLLEDNQFCVPVMASKNIDATHDTIKIKMNSKFGEIGRKDLEFYRKGMLILKNFDDLTSLQLFINSQ